MTIALSALASFLEGSQRYGEATIEGISHDSRRMEPGWIFCATRGNRGDGHLHAAEAIANGASALLVEKVLSFDIPQITVPNVRAALGPAAAAVEGWPIQKLRSVGITGTDGKTTTSYLLEGILAAHGWTTGLVGTVETRIAGRGSPSTLTTPEAPDLQRHLAAMVKDDVDAVVMEVSSHGIDQQRVDGIRFDVAVFTNLFAEHLDYHGTIEHYWATKAKLFEPSRAAAGVVGVDGEWGQRLAYQAAIPTKTFGRSPEADLEIREVRATLEGTTLVGTCRAGGPKWIQLWSPMVGGFNAYNMAAAYLAALTLGVPADVAEEGLAACSKVPGRFEQVDEGQPFLVVVDYAHTPDALGGLIATARDLASGKVIVVVGARGGRDRLKRPRTGRAAAQADMAILTTDSPGFEDPSHIARELLIGTFDVPERHVVIELDRAAAIAMALQAAGPGDAVLIVGRGHERSRHLGEQEVPFDDRNASREVLRNLGYSTSGTRRAANA